MTKYMEDLMWYTLVPPAIVGGKKFPFVLCEYQVPNQPNEFVVRGVPEGETTDEAFVLIFTERGRLKATPTAPPLQKLRLVR